MKDKDQVDRNIQRSLIHGAVQDIILEAVTLATEEAAHQATRLGRPVTFAEAGQIARMVSRQLQTALRIAKTGG